MRSSRFTYSQILAILKQNEGGAKVPDLCQAKPRRGRLLHCSSAIAKARNDTASELLEDCCATKSGKTSIAGDKIITASKPSALIASQGKASGRNRSKRCVW